MKVFPGNFFLMLFHVFFLLHSNALKAEEGPESSLVKVKKYNLGLVMNNPSYTIYRSAQLGYNGLAFLKNYLASKNLPFPKTIIYMNFEGYKKSVTSIFRDFALDEFKSQEKYNFRFYHSFDYENRTYLDGQNPYHPGSDIDAQGYLNAEAKRLFGVQRDGKKDGGVDALMRILEIVLNKDNHPVLYHCYGGRHRTGIVTLAIRYLQGGEWVSGDKRRVFVPILMKHLWLNPAQYEYFYYNKEMFRRNNLQFIEKFSLDERFLLLQEKYKGALKDGEVPQL